MPLIDATTSLSPFRASLTGSWGVDLAKKHGQVLIQLPVGIGKSTWLDQITLEAVNSIAYDLVVVLSPTRGLIEERLPLQSPPAGIKVVNLRPRPSSLCGPQRDVLWQKCDAQECGALGRRRICDRCSHRSKCFWPDQYSTKLRDTRILYATQTHLELFPDFILRLRSWAMADTYLVLMDESNFIAKPMNRLVNREDLTRFLHILDGMNPKKAPKRHQQWIDLTRGLLMANTNDLQSLEWRTPWIEPDWAYTVQARGQLKYGDAFRYPAFDLVNFQYSDIHSRRLAEDGNLEFSTRPYLGDSFIVFSGTADRTFTEYRYGRKMASPLADHQFAHPDTRWYNIASSLGTKRHFLKNSPQVLDFFAELIAMRLREGKRPLLICKKMFMDTCVSRLTERLIARGFPQIRIISEGWDRKVLADPNVIPVINYGVIGINVFEHFDAAYCLTGYYVNEVVVNTCLQDVTRKDLQLDIEIHSAGSPKRRTCGVADPRDTYYDVNGLAPLALQNQELDPVVQAVGRVRPFTRPREIITFQMGQLPRVTYTQEFNTLAEARVHFGIPTLRSRKRTDLAAQCRELRAQGVTQKEVARQLGISERSVRRYEQERKAKNQVVSASDTPDSLVA